MSVINLNGSNQNSGDVINLNVSQQRPKIRHIQKPAPEITPKPTNPYTTDGKNYDKAAKKFSKLQKGMANKLDVLDKAWTVYDFTTAIQTPPSDLTPGGIAAYYAKLGLILAPSALPLIFPTPPSFAVAAGFSVLTELASEDVQRMVYQSVNGLVDLGMQIASGIENLHGGEKYQQGKGFSIQGFNFFTSFPNSKLWLGLGDPFGQQLENQIRINIRDGLTSSPNLYPGSYDQMSRGTGAPNPPPMNSSRNMPMPMPGVAYNNRGSSDRGSSRANDRGPEYRIDRPGMDRDINNNRDAAKNPNPDKYDVKIERNTYTKEVSRNPINVGIEKPGRQSTPIRPEVWTLDVTRTTTTNQRTGETKVDQKGEVYKGLPRSNTNTNTNSDRPASNNNSNGSSSNSNRGGTTSGGSTTSGGNTSSGGNRTSDGRTGGAGSAGDGKGTKGK